jgi:hypothetical protein
VVELISRLGEDLIFVMCLGVNAIALVLNRNFRKHGCHWRRWLGVFIASNHFLVVSCFYWRWAHRTVRWCTGHVLSTVWCAPRQHTRWGLEQSAVEVVCPVVSPDSLVPHQTCPVHSGFSAMTSDLHCSLWQSTVGAMLPLLRWHTGHVPVHTGQSGEL